MERFEDHVGLIHRVTRQAWAKSMQLGSHLEYEDVFQEASLAFVAANKSFKPEMGFAFSTYYTRCAWSHFRKMLEKEGLRAERITDEERLELPAAGKTKYVRKVSIVSTESLMRREGEDDAEDFFDRHVDDSISSPEQIVELREQLAELEAGLSPLARKMLDCLHSPSPEVLAEIQRMEHHRAAVAGKEAQKIMTPSLSDLCHLFRVTGYPIVSVDRAKQELTTMAKQF